MDRNAEKKSTMRQPRHDLRRLRARVRKQRYVVDEQAVADAMLSRPMMRFFLAPSDRDRRMAA